MKTAEEFIDEITKSDELQSELKKVVGKDALTAFLKKYDCSSTAEEFADIIIALPEDEGEIPDDVAEIVAGGGIGDIFSSLWRLLFK